MLTTVCEGVVTLRCFPRFAAELEALSEGGAPSLCSVGIFERLFREADGPSGRAATALLPLSDGETRIFLRQLKRGGWIGPLLGARGAGSRRAERELDVTRLLFERGAPVPEPALLLVEAGRGCAIGTLYVGDSSDGLAFLESGATGKEVLTALVACAEAVRHFHDLGGRHPDLQVKNLLISREDGWRAHVIDLDGAKLGSPAKPERRMRELMRLYRSLAKRGVLARVGRSGVARFFGAYCRAGTGDPQRELRRALWSCLPKEWRRVTRHGLLYRGGPASLRLPRRRAP